MKDGKDITRRDKELQEIYEQIDRADHWENMFRAMIVREIRELVKTMKEKKDEEV